MSDPLVPQDDGSTPLTGKSNINAAATESNLRARKCLPDRGHSSLCPAEEVPDRNADNQR